MHRAMAQTRPIVAGAPMRTALAVVVAATALVVTPPPARAATARPAALLKQGTGMRSQPSVRVRVLQRALVRQGYSVGAPGVDGRFGPLTAAAVRRLQADHRL